MENLFLVPIQEDVIFPEGEEVDELLSISLDPQVHQTDSALSGSVEVTGEYSIVTEEEDNIRQFFRNIPVQVFIPSHHYVTADSDIQIHSFDYDVEKPGKLSLSAELAVVVSKLEEQAVIEFETVNEFEEEAYEEEAYEEEAYEEEAAEEASEELIEEEEESSETEAAVQVQKRTEDAEASIFSWLDERPQQQAQWRFSIASGNVELISTQDEEQPPEE